MTSLQALFKIYRDALFDHHPDVRQICEDLANELKNGCQARDSQVVQDAHSKLQKAINDLEILQLMKSFTEQQGPLGKAMLQYMQMVLEMAMYIRAVRTANWELHLEATECFLKYFFAHDKLNYARLIPVYVADMKSLSDSDPDIYKEFISGNWVVNKNSIPFCAIGADHALEQVNRMMKVSGGLVGITQNSNALAKFFLAAPELSNIANEANKMAGLKSRKPETHHDLSDAATSRQERDVSELTNTIRQFCDPFRNDYDNIINIVTKAVVTDIIQTHIIERNSIGGNLLAKFIEQRVVTNEVNLWSPVKKQKLQTWTANNKRVKVKDGDKVIELTEDRSLFARLLVVSKARNIDLQQNIGMFEFTVVPRALFALDGSLLHVTSKSDLMEILESLPQQKDVEAMDTSDDTGGDGRSAAIVDGMAELQCLDKP